jgi:hypothetical protein
MNARFVASATSEIYCVLTTSRCQVKSVRIRQILGMEVNVGRVRERGPVMAEPDLHLLRVQPRRNSIVAHVCRSVWKTAHGTLAD